MKQPLLLATLFVLTITASVATATPAAEPVVLTAGQWEVTQTAIGGPRNEAPRKLSACLKEDALKQPEVAFRQVITSSTKDVPRCKPGDVMRGVDTISWRGTCDHPRGGDPVAAVGQATYTSSAYEGKQTLTVKMPFGSVDIKETVKAIYLGACS